MAKIDGLLMDIDIKKVSDIHITSGAKPMVRIDGNLVDVCEEIIRATARRSPAASCSSRSA